MTAHPALIAWPEDPSDAAGLALWTSEDIAVATGGRASARFAVSGVEIDSRDVVEGDLFFALKGESSDGHRYLEGAAGRGAAGAVVEHACFGPHVLVSNTSSALEDLGKAARNRVDAGIIGVTGSAGKTGVKEALYSALDRASRGRAHRSVKSYNNHVGVPLSMARMPAATRFGVFEMGMNHTGELAVLTRLVRPHVAIVTTIAPAHIGHFSGEEEIADAKGEIFEGLEHGGIAIIPADSRHFERLQAKAARHAGRIVSFGNNRDATVRLIDALPAAGGGTLVTADLGGRKVCYTIAQPGAHWVSNSLAIMAAVEAIGGDLGAAGLALAEMEGLAGRGARHAIPASAGDGSGTALLIDESYNANPASMAVTLQQLGQTSAARRVAILGAMRELGADEARYHAELAGPVAEGKVDRLILVGPEMAALASALGKSGAGSLAAAIDVAHVENTAEAAECLAAGGVRGGDAILVKGSNSVGLGALVRTLTAREQ
ncbi:MAG: UDP-N-acetylmuramoyl-tripeptide--D-alanyl-D-alanine ligase [Novosphingobium sp.]